jgi:hypothetical protein
LTICIKQASKPQKYVLGVTGLTEGAIATLKALGAIEKK